MNLKIFWLGLVLLALVKSQEEEIEDRKTKTKEQIIEEQQNLLTLLKTLHYSCIVLARFQLSQYGEQLMDMINMHKNQNDQNILWKKMYVGHVIKCQKTITYDDSVKIFTEIKSNEFDFSKYSHVYDEFNLDQYVMEKVAFEFTAQEEKTWEYIEDFENSMVEKQQKEKEETEENLLKNRLKNLGSLDLEPKIFGMSTKTDQTTQLILLIAIFILSGLGFYKGQLIKMIYI